MIVILSFILGAALTWVLLRFVVYYMSSGGYMAPILVGWVEDNIGMTYIILAVLSIPIGYQIAKFAYKYTKETVEEKIEVVHAEPILHNGLEEISSHIAADPIKSDVGYILSENIRVSQKSLTEHIVYIGPPGAGKTTSGYITNLLDDTAITGSAIITDTKKELIRDTGTFREECGNEVYYFSPFEPNHSVRINPLLQMKDTSSIRQLANAMLMNGAMSEGSNQDWLAMANPLLTSVLIAAIRTSQNPTISKCIKKIIETEDEQLGNYIRRSGDPEALDSWNVYRQSAKAQSTAGGIRTVMSSSMQLFLDRSIDYVTSGNDISLEDLRTKKISLYIHIPESKVGYAKPLTATLFYTIFDMLATVGGHQVLMLLDEFGNLGKIPQFDSFVTLFRGRNAPFVLGVQSINQMDQIYGSAGATIKDSLKTKIFFPGVGQDTGAYAAAMLDGCSIGGKPATASVIRQIGVDELIVISKNLPAIKDTSAHYTKYPEKVKRVSNQYTIRDRTDQDIAAFVFEQEETPEPTPTPPSAEETGKSLLEQIKQSTDESKDEGVDF